MMIGNPADTHTRSAQQPRTQPRLIRGRLNWQPIRPMNQTKALRPKKPETTLILLSPNIPEADDRYQTLPSRSPSVWPLFPSCVSMLLPTFSHHHPSTLFWAVSRIRVCISPSGPAVGSLRLPCPPSRFSPSNNLSTALPHRVVVRKVLCTTSQPAPSLKLLAIKQSRNIAHSTHTRTSCPRHTPIVGQHTRRWTLGGDQRTKSCARRFQDTTFTLSSLKLWFASSFCFLSPLLYECGACCARFLHVPLYCRLRPNRQRSVLIRHLIFHSRSSLARESTASPSRNKILASRTTPPPV
jgi:hypothetical protein